MSIAFHPDEFTDSAREFRGQIVRAEYKTPWTKENSPFAEESPDCVRIEIVTEQYSKPQYEWYPPTRLTKTKWYYFIKALYDTGAMNDIKIEGNTDDERVWSLCKQLIGMEFYWKEFTNLEGFRKDRPITRLLLPVEYLGKAEIKRKPPEEVDVATEKIGGGID